MWPVDYTLYLVTDRQLCSAPTLEEGVELAIAGGVTLVQLREKGVGGDELLERARGVKRVCDAHGVPMIVNDNIEVARQCGAAGVHVGQGDVPCRAARELLGPDATVGVSAHTVEEALAAQCDGASYLGAGAVFGTSTKRDALPLGVDGLAAVCAAVDIPVVAIGGVDLGNVGRLAGTGVAGAAVVSGIIAQPDIKAAARDLRAALRDCL